MRAALLAVVLLSGCALRGEPASACSDPLRLFLDQAYECCCERHDSAYLAGGTEADRLKADQALYRCVAVWNEPDAASMFVAVRKFGSSRFHYRKD
jgi:hypothetical protein